MTSWEFMNSPEESDSLRVNGYGHLGAGPRDEVTFKIH